MTLKEKLFHIVFQSDTRLGQRFDQILIIAILSSLVIVVLDSIEVFSKKYHSTLWMLEWIFTLLFTIEYAVRIYCCKNRRAYIFSFFGLIDLLAILPTYLALLFPDLHALIDVRVLRLVRIFRIFKLTAYISEYTLLADALRASRRKIFVFLSVVLMFVMVMGTLMYVIEGPQNGYTSIPVGIYWAITTMTTVGFGDITPKTDLGRLISSLMMLMGWGTLAVPTGIVTAEMTYKLSAHHKGHTCPSCLAEDIGFSDNFCKHCGESLDQST